ncbi:MAG TPA: PQQ-dependent sugar dehydrogenase [Acidimicrobiales bacterium]|nr:PQQ-dependent sugar dehydrogenase [Acidimicrobiales bacterium]
MRDTLRTRTLGIVGAAVGLLALGTLTGCRAAPSDLQVTTAASGIGRPWDLAFSPGGQLFFTERGGKIRFRTAGGTIRTLATPSDVAPAGEGGMLGIALDPKFSSNRRIYTCFRSTAGGAADIRLVRWRVNDATTGLEQRADIVTGMPTNSSGRHSGCRPRFGPDGHIWMGTGDAATNTVPQDPKSLGGKVLRIDTNGKGVAGNATSPFDPRIYTYGHRNVQGIAFSPGGKAYSIEHGTGRDDEVNLLVARANYGWDPKSPGGGSAYDESRPMTDLAKFPDARRAIWSSGNPTIAPSGGTFLKGEKWSGWAGTLAIAVLKDQKLLVLAFDSKGTAVEQQWTNITGRGRLRVAVQGPDGNLYLAVDSDPGTILKVTPTA